MEREIDQALRGDAGLAGVQWLLGGPEPQGALRAALDALLPGPAVLGECRLYRAKYKPGRHLTAYYTAAVGDPASGGGQARHVEVVWRPQGATPSRAAPDDRAMQEEARRRGLAAPFLHLSASDPEWRMGLRISPLDPEFPQLARLSDPGHMGEILGGAYTASVVRYRPGQRHVLRYDPGGEEGPGSLFAKAYNSDKGLRTYGVARTFAGWLEAQGAPVRTVSPAGYIAELQTVLYPWAAGTPLSQLLRAPGPGGAAQLALAGEALRALHRSPLALVPLQAHSLARELKGVASAAEHINTLLPATGAQIGRSLERAEALHARLPYEPPGFAYGDYKADHLWAGPGGLTLIDFDTCYLFDQAIDLGKFLADLRWWHDSYGLAGVEQAQARFLDGYRAGGGRLERARLYEVLVLLKTTARRVRLFDSDWAGRTAALVDRAEALLDALEATA